VAHAIWLDDDDLALLAERGVVVSVNSSSNLRLRSGRARLARMLELGVRVAIGMDGMSLDDDEDMLRELRLSHLINDGTGLDPGPSALALLSADVVNGPAAAAGEGAWGLLQPGAPADLMVLDGGALLADVAPTVRRDPDRLAAVVLARARASHVTDLVVAGRTVVAGGEVTAVDERSLAAEVAATCRQAAPDDRLEVLVAALQAGVRRFLETGGHTTGALVGHNSPHDGGCR
jgi:cytosine/adenosine deaminase-related metal-dependent hydrolase